MAFVLGIYCMNVMAQNDKTFRHTIELGQTVYSIATSTAFPPRQFIS